MQILLHTFRSPYLSIALWYVIPFENCSKIKQSCFPYIKSSLHGTVQARPFPRPNLNGNPCFNYCTRATRFNFVVCSSKHQLYTMVVIAVLLNSFPRYHNLKRPIAALSNLFWSPSVLSLFTSHTTQTTQANSSNRTIESRWLMLCTSSMK